MTNQFKDKRAAIKHAEACKRLYGNLGEPLFVVYEGGYYHICSDEDIDTYFNGIHQEDIVYCTN